VGAGLVEKVAGTSRGGPVRGGGPQAGLLAGDEVEHDVADTRVTAGLFGAAARLLLADQRVHLGAVHGGRALGGPDRKEMGVAARRGVRQGAAGCGERKNVVRGLCPLLPLVQLRLSAEGAPVASCRALLAPCTTRACLRRPLTDPPGPFSDPRHAPPARDTGGCPCLSVPGPFRSGGGLLGCGPGERPVGVHDAPLTVDELVAV
jgi:hypothetical protein